MADPLGYQLGKWAVIAGAVLIAVGVLLMAGARLGFLHLGRLPGDIAYKGKSVRFYFPIVTCLLLSVIVTFVMWLISYLRRP